MLIVLSGLPGTGKTAIARLLARRLAAVHLRVDTIEQAVRAREPGLPIGTFGYELARKLAADNLSTGAHVIADCVNPAEAARKAWMELATMHGIGRLLVAIRCSDVREHQRRVEGRVADIEGHQLPSWAAVTGMRFDPLADADIDIDTAIMDPETAAELIASRVSGGGSTLPPAPVRSLSYVSLVVRDYDEAIAWYCGVLGFSLAENTYVPAQEKRWVLLAPSAPAQTRLLLARASSAEQLARVGDQTGGRVFLFLRSMDFWKDFRELTAKGVVFVRSPSEERYGTVAVFKDLYGNLWDLLELKDG